MKKLLGIVVLSLLISTNIYAEGSPYFLKGITPKFLINNGTKWTKYLAVEVNHVSIFYGPFRKAIVSKGILKGEKKITKWILEIVMKH
mgnify:CR=1 FL=1